MTVFERLHMPSLVGAAEWLNSEPLGPAELRGHVVLVNFWTLYLHQLAAPGAVRPCVVPVITFLEPGAEAYVFTFG